MRTTCWSTSCIRPKFNRFAQNWAPKWSCCKQITCLPQFKMHILLPSWMFYASKWFECCNASIYTGPNRCWPTMCCRTVRKRSFDLTNNKYCWYNSVEFDWNVKTHSSVRTTWSRPTAHTFPFCVYPNKPHRPTDIFILRKAASMMPRESLCSSR